MSEIEKIYQCVFDKAYLNKVELSILLDMDKVKGYTWTYKFGNKTF